MKIPPHKIADVRMALSILAFVFLLQLSATIMGSLSAKVSCKINPFLITILNSE
jgi:hypothetical protein